MDRLRSLLVILCLPIFGAGCTLLQTGGETAEPLPLRPSQGAAHFDRVAQAAQHNAIVLQVAGAEEPLRVLPLPSDGQAVYVSDLLRQSGLSEEFPRMQARLYRNSPEVIGGIRMGINFRPGTNQVAPEHDYCLRPGDRLEVAEEEVSPFASIFGDMPKNGRRAILGF